MNINKMTKEELLNELTMERININELNLHLKTQREAFFDAIKTRPALLSKISGINERHFLLPAIEQNPSLFIYLTSKQYTNELAQIYLNYRLDSSLSKNKEEKVVSDFSCQKSIDNKVLLNYNYTSKDGDELYYFDNELQVPISIKSYFKATLKIIDAIAFINKFDIHITQLGANKIKTTIIDVLENCYKEFLSSYITKQNIGFYTLSTTLSDFEKEFKSKISRVLDSYGVAITDFIIKKLAIPKDIQNKLEDQALQIRQLRSDNEASNEFARMSLENYEKKLSIQEKYPEAEHSLTEYEKDLALKRYLIKQGRKEDNQVNRVINIDNDKNVVDDTIDKKKDIELETPKKSNGARGAYFSTMIILAIINLALLFYVPGPALILLGVLTALYGLIGALCYESLRPYETKEGLVGDNTSEHGTENISNESNETTAVKEEENEL